MVITQEGYGVVHSEGRALRLYYVVVRGSRRVLGDSV